MYGQGSHKCLGANVNAYTRNSQFTHRNTTTSLCELTTILRMMQTVSHAALYPGFFSQYTLPWQSATAQESTRYCVVCHGKGQRTRFYRTVGISSIAFQFDVPENTCRHVTCRCTCFPVHQASENLTDWKIRYHQDWLRNPGGEHAESAGLVSQH